MLLVKRDDFIALKNYKTYNEINQKRKGRKNNEIKRKSFIINNWIINDRVT